MQEELKYLEDAMQAIDQLVQIEKGASQLRSEQNSRPVQNELRSLEEKYREALRHLDALIEREPDLVIAY